jgi:hypothetical protein
MDALLLVAIGLAILAAIGLLSSTGGVDSRDGFPVDFTSDIAALPRFR